MSDVLHWGGLLAVYVVGYFVARWQARNGGVG